MLTCICNQIHIHVVYGLYFSVSFSNTPKESMFWGGGGVVITDLLEGIMGEKKTKVDF